MPAIVFKEESYGIIGACFEVYNELGSGFLEGVYQESLALEFRSRAIPFAAKRELELSYKGQILESTYQPDFICYDAIIVELKSASGLVDRHRAQVHNYLKATGYRLGLLVNFGGEPQLQYERIVR
jgi:GxxExxY protein